MNEENKEIVENTPESENEEIVENILKLENGETVELGITFKRLAILQKVNPSIYNEFTKIMSSKSGADLLSMLLPLYVGYWCKNYEIEKHIYTYEEFRDLCPFDLNLVKKKMNQLIFPKKKKNLEKTS